MPYGQTSMWVTLFKSLYARATESAGRYGEGPTVHRDRAWAGIPVHRPPHHHAPPESSVQRPASKDRSPRYDTVLTLDPRHRTLDTPLVGRSGELTQLHHWLDKALQGERQIVFVTGEPGIGKTTVVEAFLIGIRDWGLGVGSATLPTPILTPPVSGLTLIPNPQSPTPNLQSDAEACFRRAIAIARKQQTKSLELRAVTSLSRLWQQHGEVKQAHTMLSEIYHWFTEGFETADLREAKTLLEELQG
jgi:hypothetical protein